MQISAEMSAKSPRFLQCTNQPASQYVGCGAQAKAGKLFFGKFVIGMRGSET
jgi:hypothetical protein